MPELLSDAPKNVLRKATANAHDRLENSGFSQRLFSPALDSAQLSTILRQMAGLYGPLEALLLKGPLTQDIGYRSRMPLLKTGIQKLEGYVQKENDLREALPKHSFDLSQLSQDDATLLGIIYVLDGSTLGGLQIFKQLAPRFAAEAIAFFRPYGDQTVEHWQTVCSFLDQRLKNPDELQTATNAARYTFELFYIALTHNQHGS